MNRKTALLLLTLLALPAAARADELNASVTLNGQGLTVTDKSGDEVFRLHGYVDADARFFIGDKDNNGTDSFDLRRARLILEGSAQGFYYMVSPDFGGSGPTLYDAYAGYKYGDPFDIRMGKFKSPLGLEELRATPDLTFAETGMATQLVPQRDTGAQIESDWFDKKLTLQAGLFNGGVDGGNDNTDKDDNKEGATRIFVEPVKGIGFGAAGSWGSKAGADGKSILPSYATPGRVTFFQYGTHSYADGAAWRVIPQGYAYEGPFGLMAEYAVSAQEVRNGAARTDLHNTAWNVQAGWVLTGEDATYKSVAPEHPFDPHNGGWGAWEIAARYGVLNIDDAAFPVFASFSTAASAAHDTGIVLNGYLTDHARLVFDYEHTSFDGGKAGGADREAENVFVTRVQMKF